MKKNYSGYLLIELIITLGIISCLIPTFFQSYLTVQKNILYLNKNLKIEREFVYLDNFLRRDLKTVLFFKKIEENDLIFQNLSQETVEYKLVNQTLKRILTKVQNGKITQSTSILSQDIFLTAFRSNLILSNLLELNLIALTTNQNIVIYLANLKS